MTKNVVLRLLEFGPCWAKFPGYAVTMTDDRQTYIQTDRHTDGVTSRGHGRHAHLL